MQPEAVEQFQRWGLTPADVDAAGLFVAESVRSLYPDMPDGAAIVIPYYGPDGALRRYRTPQGGELPFARVRWLSPRQTPSMAFSKPGKGQRYDQPPRSGVAAYFPRAINWAEIIGDVSRGIVITEGEAKAICAVKHGIPTIALGGVYSFMTKDAAGLLPELEAITWRDRDVYLCFDSDAATNPQVMAAEGRLADELQRARGAKLRIIRLPGAEGGGKVGLDDYLTVAGAGAFSNLCRATGAVNAFDVKILRLNASVAWIEAEGGIYDLEQKQFIQKANFTSGSHHSSQKHTVPTARGVKQISVAQEWLTHPLAQRFSQVLFRPGEGRTVPCEGGRALNIWDGFQHPEPGDVTPFLKLTAHLFSTLPANQRDLPLRLLAYKARNPQKKIPLSIVMVGPEGAGKSLWGECVTDAFEAYGKSMSAEQMVGKFNGWAEKCLVAVVDEAAANTIAENKEKVRAMISQMRIMMEEKFRPQREINCYTFFIFNSNRRAVSSYSYADRRMIVADIPPKREADFYADVGKWRAAGGPHKLMHYLLTVDLKGWEPPSEAPASAEKMMAYAEGLTAIEKLADDMRHGDGPNTIMQWIASAMAWAAQAELSPNHTIAAQARAVSAALPNFQIRPFYTAAELVMLFPLLQAQSVGVFKSPPSPGEVSRALREAGIPYLQNKDRPDGFMMRSRMQQYLIIGDFERWREPITQAEFDAAGPWPTYGQLARVRNARL